MGSCQIWLRGLFWTHFTFRPVVFLLFPNDERRIRTHNLKIREAKEFTRSASLWIIVHCLSKSVSPSLSRSVLGHSSASEADALFAQLLLIWSFASSTLFLPLFPISCINPHVGSFGTKRSEQIEAFAISAQPVALGLNLGSAAFYRKAPIDETHLIKQRGRKIELKF